MREFIKKQKSIFFKIFLIGKKGVGKSTFIKSLYPSGYKIFDSNLELTIGVDFYSYDYPIKTSNERDFIRFQIWVYNPESRFKDMFNCYIIGSHVILFIFDVSDLRSLKEIDSTMEVIRKQHYTSIYIPIMLLGNKADLTEHLESAKVLADSNVKKYHLKGYYEISAKDSTNVELIFTSIAEPLLEWYKKK